MSKKAGRREWYVLPDMITTCVLYVKQDSCVQLNYCQRSGHRLMFYTRQKYYHADFGYFKLSALPGWEEYVQKVKKSS
jgi:hypothetical protein